MAKTRSFCDDGAVCLPTTARLVWAISWDSRSALHPGGRCAATAPFTEAGTVRPRPDCENAGCVDLFMTVWLAAHEALHARAAEPRNPAGYVTIVARTQLAELSRRRRVERGGVAKPQRRDGIVGKVCAGYTDRWLEEVLRFLLGYAAASGAGAGAGWPLDALTRRKNEWDGGGRTLGTRAARAEILRDIDCALDAVRTVAGIPWLYDSLLLPLANRPATTSDVDEVAADDDDLLDRAAAAIDAMHARVRAGEPAHQALPTAVAEHLGELADTPRWAALAADELALRRLIKSLAGRRPTSDRAA